MSGRPGSFRRSTPVRPRGPPLPSGRSFGTKIFSPSSAVGSKLGRETRSRGFFSLSERAVPRLLPGRLPALRSGRPRPPAASPRFFFPVPLDEKQRPMRGAFQRISSDGIAERELSRARGTRARLGESTQRGGRRRHPRKPLQRKKKAKPKMGFLPCFCLPPGPIA